jgi:hypothetical protein
LADKYGDLNAKSMVLMNQAWEVPELGAPPANPKARIGWTASGGHLEDAQELAQLLAQAKAANPGLFEAFTLCLMTTPRNAQAFEAQGLVFEHTQTGSFEHYMAFISTLDGGLAHLGAGDFAQGRSDGKYIEYASRGVPVICHDSGTYAHTIRHMANGLLYRNASDFVAALGALVQKPGLRQHLRGQAHRNLVEHRNHAVAAQDRYAFYEGLVQGSQGSPVAAQRSPFAVPGFTSLEDPIEQALREVMDEHNQEPQPETIRRYFQLSQSAPTAWKVWERFEDLYRTLGLEEHLELLSQRAAESKEAALTRAFQQAA